MDILLTSRQALICGSTQGIGLAIAQEFARLGATCTLMARDKAALVRAVDTLDRSADQTHGYLVADFTDLDAVRQAIGIHVGSHEIHILVNNTGGPPPGPLLDAGTEDLAKAFSMHILCYQLLAQAALPSMKKEGYGRIINIVSTSVRIPIPNLGVSNTIRAATAGWAKTLANESGQYGITVNNILPGFTATKRLDSLIQNIARAKGLTTEEVARDMKAEIPARRFGEASDIANLAAFLASPAAAYINGTNIPVDGGRTGSF
jgi:3-oxoacyl-[acyl-carrier protein] reductase